MIRVTHAAAVAATVLFPLALAAGEVLPTDEPILIDEWREMTRGKTLYYSLGGVHWGREYFHPDGDRATFISSSGACTTAPWVYADGVFCFSYTGLDCFRHVRRDGQLMAIPISQGEAQTIDRITTEPLSCQPPLTS